MSQRRFNDSIATGNFTGATTGATFNGTTLHIGETQVDYRHLSAHVVATITMTNATLKYGWQVSNDGTNFFTAALNQENTAAPVIATGVASGTTLDLPAPLTVYGYKYARVQLQWTSTTAGTTNDAMSVGYCYRRMDAGSEVG